MWWLGWAHVKPVNPEVVTLWGGQETIPPIEIKFAVSPAARIDLKSNKNSQAEEKAAWGLWTFHPSNADSKDG